MKNPLFLIGAGFNFDAKEETGKNEIICRYPLLYDLYRLCFPDNEIDPSISIEELFHESIQRNEFDPVRRLYEKIMEADYYLIPELNNNHANCYKTFFNKFRNSNFLTFNYDSLAEIFLFKLKQWSPHDGYGVPVEIDLAFNANAWFTQQNSKCLILHLHGSLCIYISDFEIDDSNNIKLRNNPVFKFDPASIADLFYPYRRAQLDESYQPDLKDRVIAPVPDKTEGLKNDFIEQMYNKARILMNNTNKIIVIGYSFNKNDKSSYHKLLKDYKNEILLISPNSSDDLKHRLKDEYPDIHWHSQSSSFKHWVDTGYKGLI